MATVVNLGAGRVDPYKELGRVIESGASRLADVMMAQSQQEWQEKMRREAEDRAEKRQKDQDKRLLNRQISLEQNKRVYEQSEKRADAINNANAYSLVNEVSKVDKYGKRVLDPDKQEAFWKVWPSLAAYTDGETQSSIQKTLTSYGDNAAEAVVRDALVESRVKAGIPRNLAIAVDDKTSLTDLINLSNGIKEANEPLLKALVANKEVPIDIAMLRDEPNPVENASRHAQWVDWKDRLEGLNLTPQDARKMLAKDNWITDFRQNQANIDTLITQFAARTDLPGLQNALPVISALNGSYEATKTALTEITKLSEQDAIRTALGDMLDGFQKGEAPTQAQLSILLAEDSPTGVQALTNDLHGKYLERAQTKFDYQGGAKFVKEIDKNPLHDWHLDPRSGIFKDQSAVTDRLQMASHLSIANRLGEFDAFDAEGKKEEVGKLMALYSNRPEAYRKSIEAKILSNDAIKPLFSVLTKLREGQPLGVDELSGAYGALLQYDIPGEGRIAETIFNQFVDPTEYWTVGGRKVKATAGNIAALLELERKIDTSKLTEQKKHWHWALLRHARSKPGEAGHLHKNVFHRFIRGLDRPEQEAIIAVMDEQVVNRVKIDVAVSNKVLEPGEAKLIAKLPTTAIDDAIRVAGERQMKTADYNLTTWSAGKRIDPKTNLPVLPNFEDFKNASVSVKNTILTQLGQDRARQFLRTNVLADFEKERASNVKILNSLGVFDISKPLDKAFIEAAAENSTIVQSIVKNVHDYQLGDATTQKEMGEKFVMEKVWGKFFTDLDQTLAIADISTRITGWDNVKKIPTGVVIDSRTGKERALNAEDIKDLRFLRTQTNLFHHYIKHLGIESGTLSGVSFAAKDGGQRQYNIIAARLVQDLMGDALRRGKLPVFSEILSYAHMQAAGTKYKDVKNAFLQAEATGEWKKLTDITKLKPLKNWESHDMKVEGHSKRIPLGSLPQQRRKIYEAHFMGSDHLQMNPTIHRILKHKEDGAFVFPGSNTVERRESLIKDMLTEDTEIALDPDTNRLPHSDDIDGFSHRYNNILTFQYHLGKMLSETFKATGSGNFDDAFRQEMETQLSDRKQHLPSWGNSGMADTLGNAAQSVLGTGVAYGAQEKLNHDPHILMGTDLYATYKKGKESLYTPRQLHYLAARLRALQNVLTKMNGNSPYPTDE